MEWRPTPGSGLLSDRVAQQIERMIIDAGLKPGEKLGSGRELGERFGVSRTVIRDALAALQQRGLIEQRPGVGVFVCDGSGSAVATLFGQMLRLDTISLQELVDARLLIEVHNAELAARHATEDDIARLNQLLETMETARNGRRFIEADVEFHVALAAAAGNRVLAAVLQGLHPVLIDAMTIGLAIEEARPAAVMDHREVIDLIARHDVTGAGRSMAAHLKRTRSELEQAGYLPTGKS